MSRRNERNFWLGTANIVEELPGLEVGEGAAEGLGAAVSAAGLDNRSAEMSIV